MKAEIVFHEYQETKKSWRWLIGIAIEISVLIITPLLISSKTDYIASIITAFIVAVITSHKKDFLIMESFIDNNGLYIRFLPKFLHFQTRYKYFPWTEVSAAQIKKYNPKDFHFKIDGFGRTRTYQMGGNIGLYFMSKNKKQVFLGTNDPETLSTVLEKLGKLNV
ncbi:MAG: hypothetical protein LBT50_08140 [Prevotellaceae bacterium]|jgi:hypothetical protein|nr:hypothetical protein [Prevotellaceae bacterium]